MRISTNTIIDNNVANIQFANDRFAKAQETISTGKVLNQPSDDPGGLSQALSIQTTLDNLGQYKRNVDDAKGFVGLTDTALTQLTNEIRAARQIAVQGANGSLGIEQRTSLADQTNQIATEVAQIANSTYGSRFIFGGQRTTTPPYTPDGSGSYVYQGGKVANQDANLNVSIGESEAIVINVSGDRIFDGTFKALAGLQQNLGDNQQAVSDQSISALDDALKAVTTIHAEFGANAQRLSDASDRLDQKTTHMQGLLTQIEDADLPKAIMEMQASQLAYQASLTATSRSFQVSLLDFLK